MTSSKKPGSAQGRTKKSFFEDYLPLDKVQRGLASGEIIEGVIRVNPKNFEESFILHPSGDADVFLHGLQSRNRALNDDVVAVQIEPIKKWRLAANEQGYAPAVNPATAQAKGSKGPKEGKKKEHLQTVGQLCANDPGAISALFPGAAGPVHLESCLDPPGCGELFRTVVRTGRVVAILRQMHHRAAVGTVRLMAPKEENPQQRLLFCPNDRRFPRLILDRGSYPPNIYNRPDDFKASYFVAQMLEWPNTGIYARGRIERHLGEAGDLAAELEALLVGHGVSTEEFSPEIVAELPTGQPDAAELGRRRDFRDQCVISIDPASARDLDDALHVRPLGPSAEFGFEVGVHIADVSHYVPEHSRLDIEARNRATTVYLVDRAVPMLPRRLCEDLCSLNPGEAKLTFSVVWQMDSEGRILDTWFGRSVVQSCAKLSYQHAQSFIEQPERREWPAEEMPHIFEPWCLEDVRRGVCQLYELSRAMRSRRFSTGALRLNSPRLNFVLDPETGLPCGFFRDELGDSNFLVEEMMVAANISVAERLFQTLPEEAFLRRHPAPSRRALDEVQSVCRVLGFPIDTSSAADIHQSLKGAEASTGPAGMEVLVNFLSKPMQLAQYFCCGQLARCDRETRLEYAHHYALNVDLYTHFTSPIRRYPDIVVHRQLAAILTGRDTSLVEPTKEQLTYGSPMSLTSVATQCNWRKKNAKLAGEASRDLYLRALICKLGEFSETGYVIGVLDRSFDVLLLQLGCIKRVYCDQMEGLEDARYSSLAPAKGAGRLHLEFRDGGVQEIRPMSRVKLLLRAAEDKNDLKFEVLLVPSTRHKKDPAHVTNEAAKDVITP